MRWKIRISASSPPVGGSSAGLYPLPENVQKFFYQKNFLTPIPSMSIMCSDVVKGMRGIIKATYCGNSEGLKSRLAVRMHADERCLGRWTPVRRFSHGDLVAVKALRKAGSRVRTASDWTLLMQAVL